MLSIIVKAATTCFVAICFGLAGYTIFLQFKEFFENEDLSSIAYKEYNSAKESQYPTFSICFTGGRYLYSPIYRIDRKRCEEICPAFGQCECSHCECRYCRNGFCVDKETLFGYDEINPKDYQDTLLGWNKPESWTANHGQPSITEYDTLSGIDFDNATIKMRDVLGNFRTRLLQHAKTHCNYRASS